MNKAGFNPGTGAMEDLSKDTDLIKDTTTRDFVPDVIEASQKVPVLVDFWSHRCGPCKQLTPVLEKVVRESKGKVRLVKMNVDEHPTIFSQIASQLGIQSIPAVIAFGNGRPVDGFIGALPENEVRAFVKRLAGDEGDLEAVMETADEAFVSGDYDTAIEVYGAILEEDAENLNAIAGIAKCHVEKGDLEAAKQILELAPPLKRDAAVIANVLANINLKEKSKAAGDLEPLQARLTENPNDHQARFDLALALNAKGDRSGAAEALLEIIKRQRGWNEEAAKIQLIQFFDAWGPKDPHTLEGRQRLSLLLFS